MKTIKIVLFGTLLVAFSGCASLKDPEAWNRAIEYEKQRSASDLGRAIGNGVVNWPR